MNNFPTRDEVQRVRDEYPTGTRVELIEMNDPYRNMAPGLKGTVLTVDDAGTVHTLWDNGSTLGAVYGEDRIKKIEE